MIDAIVSFVRTIVDQFLLVVAYPINPGERLFVFYLATSVIFAIAVYRHLVRSSGSSQRTGSLGQFLFPASVWRNPSAWLDVRYFFFHQILRVFLYGAFTLMVSNWTFKVTSGFLGSPWKEGAAAARQTDWFIELGYGFISVALLDLVAYGLHFCQHKIPLLWEFHKIHHSAPVMHPLTNYREHPVDNIAYATGLGGATGIVAATVSVLLGYVPAEPTLLGVGIFTFLFNGLGYNLRHSHVWLKWPGPLVYLFGSPAHHQVHHSYHATHINKNFAFMFPVWDLMFGTFEMPADNADVKFGLGEGGGENEEFRSCLGLYFVPFRNVFRLRRRNSDDFGIDD